MTLYRIPNHSLTLRSPLTQILVVLALLTRIVGPLPALAPLSALVGRALAGVRRKLMAATDLRVQLTSEVVTGAVFTIMIPHIPHVFCGTQCSSVYELVTCAVARPWDSGICIGFLTCTVA